jgi:hypothetical protein
VGVARKSERQERERGKRERGKREGEVRERSRRLASLSASLCSRMLTYAHVC